MPLVIRAGFLFFVNSFLLSSWFSRLPDVLISLGIDKADLGLALLAAPAGAITASPFVGGLAQRFTPGRLTIAAGIGMTSSMAGFGLAPNVGWLAAILYFFGIFNGVMEVGMNAVAGMIEKATGRKMIARCHGFWSLGFMCGALVSGVVTEAGISYPVHLAVTAVLGSLTVIGFAPLFPAIAYERREPDPADRAPVFALPNRLTIGVCLMAIGVTIAEGAIYDWAPLYLRQDIGASPLWASIAYATFTATMTVGRLCGDMVRERVDERLIVRGSAVLSAIGMLGFVFAPNAVVAAIALGLMGLGVSLVFPIAVNAIGNKGGHGQASNVAALSMAVMSSLLCGPPLIGIVGEALGLAVAFLLMLPFIAMTGLLASEAGERRPAGKPLAATSGNA